MNGGRLVRRPARVEQKKEAIGAHSGRVEAPLGEVVAGLAAVAAGGQIRSMQKGPRGNKGLISLTLVSRSSLFFLSFG